MEQKLIDFIKTNFGEKDNETLIYHLVSGKKFVYDKKMFELLSIGVYQTIEEQPKDIILFLAIELDENEKDTTNIIFFHWNELNDNIQQEILNEINF